MACLLVAPKENRGAVYCAGVRLLSIWCCRADRLLPGSTNTIAHLYEDHEHLVQAVTVHLSHRLSLNHRLLEYLVDCRL